MSLFIHGPLFRERESTFTDNHQNGGCFPNRGLERRPVAHSSALSPSRGSCHIRHRWKHKFSRKNTTGFAIITTRQLCVLSIYDVFCNRVSSSWMLFLSDRQKTFLESPLLSKNGPTIHVHLWLFKDSSTKTNIGMYNHMSHWTGVPGVYVLWVVMTSRPVECLRKVPYCLLTPLTTIFCFMRSLIPTWSAASHSHHNFR